jgi:tetratricopeptide (TPR) repeat protein
MSEMASTHVEHVEQLRQSALALVRAGQLDESLSVYDEALALVTDDEARELLTINKADALVALERSGPEVQALPAILMRRRKPHHTFLAAYALLFKHRVSGEAKRAMFYGHIAHEVAETQNEPFWKLAALNELAVVYEIDSQFDKAIELLNSALTALDDVSDEVSQSFSRIAILQNLGYNKLLVGQTAEGIEMLLSIVDLIESPQVRADAFIDLCYGYLDLEEYEKARFYGESGLALAGDARQLRNAHYLLGEAAYKLGDEEAAERHFDELASYYPQFRNLKTLLFAVDLRSMINLKL